jgi:enoyl-CoA hydratase
MTETILRETRGRLGLLTLNRPEALNAIDLAMAAVMRVALEDWRGDPAIAAVAVRGAGKAFSAGGDVRAAYHARGSAPAFFAAEYALIRLIHEYPKPYIALMDGVAMGGGAGLSVHGAYRVATENTRFAMPETAIGFYPDVGATWFLPRLAGETGAYLALTGARLGAADLMHTGLATQITPAAGLEALLADLAEGDAVAALARHAVPAGAADLPHHEAAIGRCFAFDRVEDILGALEAESSEWAGGVAAALAGLSPTSLKVTLRQMRLGRGIGFAAALEIERRLTARFLAGHDFYEGVRAALIDRDRRPRWQPARLEEVDDTTVVGYFGE